MKFRIISFIILVVVLAGLLAYKQRFEDSVEETPPVQTQQTNTTQPNKSQYNFSIQ